MITVTLWSQLRCNRSDVVITVTLWSQWRCNRSDVVITVTLELYVLWCLQSLWRCIRCDVMNDCSCMMACIQCMYLHCVFCCSEQRNHWMVIFIQHVSVVCRAVFLSGRISVQTDCKVSFHDAVSQNANWGQLVRHRQHPFSDEGAWEITLLNCRS